MKKLVWLACFSILSHYVAGQSFEVSGLQESYVGIIGETIKAPIRIKNNSDKTLYLIFRKVNAVIGGTQKNYFCINDNCLDQKIEDFNIKLEPGESYNILQVALEAGLAPELSSIKYAIINRYNLNETFEFELNFSVEEKILKENIYASRQLILYDVYPIPVLDHAFADYKIFDPQVKAKIVIHNILGNVMDEYLMPFDETKIKIRADLLNAGIYFYTLHVDNKGVSTRKLIVKK